MTFQITSLNIFSSETSFILIIFFIIIFIFSAYTSYKKKNNKKNNEEKEVKKKIKLYLKEKSKIKHKIIEFEKVISKSDKKSRRNIYEVFINLYDAKTKELFTKKCYEIEGFSESLDKKNFFSIWKVNREITWPEQENNKLNSSEEKEKKTTDIIFKKENKFKGLKEE